DAGGRSAGAEEVRRGRAAAEGGLRGHEATRGQNSPTGQGPADRGGGSAGAAVRGLGQKGRNGPMAEGTGGEESRREERAMKYATGSGPAQNGTSAPSVAGVQCGW